MPHQNISAFTELLAQNYELILVNLDQFFLIAMATFILFMHAGFAFLETGSVRSKNVTNSIMKNILDLFIGALAYWTLGFAFAYGIPGNAFIGHNFFFSSNVEQTNRTEFMVERYTNEKLGHYNLLTTGEYEPNGYLAPSHYYAFWFFEFVFAISATTIASGAMAERVEFASYMVYCFIMTGFVYPVVAHWCWSSEGWLKSGAGTGLMFKDFAGSGVVHVTGGTAAIVGASMLGPRIGRFLPDGTVEDYPGHSVTITALGGYILFVGFMAFNGGSELSITQPGDGEEVANAVMNTVVGGASAAVTAMLVFKLTDYMRGEQHYWSLLWAINGGLAGMVAMCATCNDLYPWAACVIGSVAGSALIGWHYFTLSLKIDDPLDAIAVHLGGGLCGVLLGPIFAVNGLKVDGEYVGGIIYGGHPMAFKNFAWNFLGAIMIMAWTASITSCLFGVMRCLGVFRCSEETETHGSDLTKHNEPAYPRKSYSEAMPLLWNRERESFQLSERPILEETTK